MNLRILNSLTSGVSSGKDQLQQILTSNSPDQDTTSDTNIVPQPTHLIPFTPLALTILPQRKYHMCKEPERDDVSV